MRLTNNQRRTHSAQREIWLLLLHEFPRGPLRKRLTGSVPITRVLHRFFGRNWVPVLLTVRMLDPAVALVSINDTGKRACDDHSLHAWRILLNGLQHTSSTDDSRVKQVLLGICDVEMEGGGSVDDCFQAVDLDGFVEGALLSNVFDDAEVELGGRYVVVRFFDFVGFVLGAYRGDDSVAVLEQDVEYVGGDEATSSWVTGISV
jgi:hypothetical protein